MKKEKLHMISAAIICQDEEELIHGCIENIYNYMDEIIILDGGSFDRTVDIIKAFPDPLQKIKLYKNRFNGHFGDQKNLAISKTNSVWVLNIDADERLPEIFFKDLPQLLASALGYETDGQPSPIDVYAFPRKNFIDGVQTDVYPDHQLRLFRSFCRYVNAVHEELVGWRGAGRGNLDDKYAMSHIKSGTRQKGQDIRYEDIKNTRGHQIGKFEIDGEPVERIILKKYLEAVKDVKAKATNQ